MKKIKVTIGTSAFNEAANIQTMLKSVCKQKEISFSIKEIIVVSDGSTDNTVKKAKLINDRRIKVIDDGLRLGQPSRISTLLDIFESDIIIFIDSDLIMKNNMTLENMIAEFKEGKKVGMVCGYLQPLPAKTFIESAIYNFKYCRKFLENLHSFQNTAYGTCGFFGIKKSLAKRIKLPKENLSHDAYCYLSCITKGYKFISINNSVVYYRLPQSFKDYISQATRHFQGGIKLKEYFSSELVNKSYHTPGYILILLMLMQLIRNPLGYIVLRVLNFYCIFQANRKYTDKINTKWDTVSSTKNLINS